MSATNATLLYIGAKPYPKPPMDSAPNDFPFLAKRFFNLQRTIFRYADICFTGFAVPYALPHLPQTVFRPKRFASFRPLLYQRFKVNFLPPNLSPKFH